MWRHDRPFPIPERLVHGPFQPSPYAVSSTAHQTGPVQFLYHTSTPTNSNTLALAPNRRKRASKPKVRTGCTTCKIRRIKCDEAKPSCKRCTSTGRKCDGYEFPREEIEETALSPPKLNATWSQLFLPSSISQAFPGDTQERRIFHRFQVCTIPAFIGGSETGFWNSLVVKVGHQEPVVRNAIIALGTLHEDYQLRGGKYSKHLIQDPNHQNALLLYGNALRQLNLRLAEGSKGANARLAIISSILFTCFEVLRRNNMAAVVHYQAGMRELLRQMNMTDEDPTKITKDELNDLLRVFARYDIQACTFSKANAQGVDIRVGLVPPTSFTLAQVRTHLDDLLITVYQLLKSSMFRYWPKQAVPVEWQKQRDEGVATFEDWLHALEEFFLTARLPPSDVKSLLGLRLQIKVAIITLKTCIDSGPEKTFDAFHDEFEDIVSRVERMTMSLQLVEGKPLDNETTSFTMELGIIHPLFFVATKCRHWILRRRAIAQLRKAGREGVWEGPITAILAERLVQMEEVGVKNGDDIPEINRLHEVRKNVDYEGSRVLVEVKRAKDGTWKDWEELRFAIPF